MTRPASDSRYAMAEERCFNHTGVHLEQVPASIRRYYLNREGIGEPEPTGNVTVLPKSCPVQNDGGGPLERPAA